MKIKIKLLLLLLLVSTVGFAQERNNLIGHVTLLKRNAELSLFVGQNTPSTTAQTEASTVKTTNIGLSLFLPITKTEAKNSVVFGLNEGIHYFVGNGDYNLDKINTYNLFGQTAPPIVSKKGAGEPKSAGFIFELGPQVNFNFGKLSVSTILNGGYLSMTQKAFETTQTTTNGTTSQTFTLQKQTETKTNGLALLPKLRLTYYFGRLGLWVEGNYLMGPTINSEQKTLAPLGEAFEGQYDAQQLELGTYATETHKTKNTSIGVNVGLSLTIGNHYCLICGKRHRGKCKYGVTEGATNASVLMIDEKIPAEIQTLIKEQDKKLNKTFEYVNKSNQKTQSLCNFKINEVDIQCNGKDNQGRKKYHVVMTYCNNATAGVSGLGNYTTACIAPAVNGTYIDFASPSTGTISGLTPAIGASTTIAPSGCKNIVFDFVSTSTTATFNIKGYTVNGASNCGNCDDMIELKLPNCCNPCEENPIVVTPISTSQLDAVSGTIRIVNAISSPNSITRIDAEIVSVKYLPISNDCIKCNNSTANQDNFVGTNTISGTGWNNSGNPAYYLGENSTTDISRAIVFTSTSATGVNLATPVNLTHTVGVSPNSCCGDTVEIWIRYSVWDKDCHVCDKLVKSTITRNGSCSGSNGGGGAGTTQNTTTKS